MKVYGKCKKCSSEISYTTNACTRVEFAMENGESKKLNCKSCGTDSKIKVDDFYAKPSKAAQIGTGLIFLFGTPIIFFLITPIFTESRNHYVAYVIGGFLLVPVFAYTVINKQDQQRVSDFNRRKLKGRQHNV